MSDIMDIRRRVHNVEAHLRYYRARFSWIQDSDECECVGIHVQNGDTKNVSDSTVRAQTT